MTSDASWQNARVWRMRAAEIHAIADEMKEIEPKAIMLRIADDYESTGRMGRKKFNILVGQKG